MWSCNSIVTVSWLDAHSGNSVISWIHISVKSNAASNLFALGQLKSDKETCWPQKNSQTHTRAQVFLVFFSSRFARLNQDSFFFSSNKGILKIESMKPKLHSIRGKAVEQLLKYGVTWEREGKKPKHYTHFVFKRRTKRNDIHKRFEGGE